jgi:hypothetical protein
VGQSFLIDVNGEAIGIAVHEDGGYRFFNFDPDYQSLNNLLFEDVESLVASATEFERTFLGREDLEAGSPLEQA